MGDTRTLDEAMNIAKAEIDRQKQLLKERETECDAWERKLNELEGRVEELEAQAKELVAGAPSTAHTLESMRALYEKLSASIAPYETTQQKGESSGESPDEIYKRIEQKLNSCSIDTVMKEVKDFNPERLIEEVDALERDVAKLKAARK